MINEITLPLATNEEEVQNYYERVNEQIGVFRLEQQTLGNHTYYRWLAQMKEDVAFEGGMDIPSVRLYFVTRTHKRYDGAGRWGKIVSVRRGLTISFLVKKNAWAKTCCIKVIL